MFCRRYLLLDMWVRQVRSSERVTPRYLECLTGVSVWLCIVYWCSPAA